MDIQLGMYLTKDGSLVYISHLDRPDAPTGYPAFGVDLNNGVMIDYTLEGEARFGNDGRQLHVHVQEPYEFPRKHFFKVQPLDAGSQKRLMDFLENQSGEYGDRFEWVMLEREQPL